MLKYFSLLLLITLCSCSSEKTVPTKETCFLLFNQKTRSFEAIENESSCQKLLPACSTFKVPLAVMGFDSRVLKNEESPVFKWKGQTTIFSAWNHDQTPRSWEQNSVVWVSQEITKKLGMKGIKRYLKDFQYGNENMTSGLKYSWLTPAPFIKEPMQNSLKISGFEQVSFLDKLWRKELKSSKESQRLTQNILPTDTSARGFVLRGKTGSGFTDDLYDQRVGWFVGHLQKGDKEYIVVLNFSDKQKVPVGTFGGQEAKEMALKRLREKGLW